MRFPLPLIGYPEQDESLFPGSREGLPISPEIFRPQQKIWSCGVATMLMIARALDIPMPEWEDCVRLLETTEENGTSTVALERGMRTLFSGYGIEIEARDNATIRELAKRLADGWYVATSFREPVEEIGHYAILQAINERALMFADPYYGRCSILIHSAFNWTTQFEHPGRPGWYCAVKRAS